MSQRREYSGFLFTSQAKSEKKGKKNENIASMSWELSGQYFVHHGQDIVRQIKFSGLWMMIAEQYLIDIDHE